MNFKGHTTLCMPTYVRTIPHVVTGLTKNFDLFPAVTVYNSVPQQGSIYVRTLLSIRILSTCSYLSKTSPQVSSHRQLEQHCNAVYTDFYTQ